MSTVYRDPTVRNISRMYSIRLEKFQQENCPCQKCTERHAACHANCEKDFQYREKLAKFREELQKESETANAVLGVRYGYRRANTRKEKFNAKN